jgi:uncharacterized protein
MTATLRSVLWRPLAGTGAEHCSLHRITRGFRLQGHVVSAVEQVGTIVPLHVHYIVDSDAAWRTRAVSISQYYGLVQTTLRLDVINMRWWTAEGVEIPQLHWLTDVDLGVTPATNTLPIRRLALEVGQRADVTAAWLRFPALTVEPLAQTYERLAPNLYRYSSNGGRFSALLETDEFGMVVQYEGGWERVAAA